MTEQYIDFASLSPDVRRWLYALAYWMASADGLLRPAEAKWLAREFGAEPADVLLAEFRQFDRDEFLATVTDGLKELQPEERHAIFPNLKQWLLGQMPPAD